MYSANPKNPTRKRTSPICEWVDPESIMDTAQTPKYPEPVIGFDKTNSKTSLNLTSLIPSDECETNNSLNKV